MNSIYELKFSIRNRFNSKNRINAIAICYIHIIDNNPVIFKEEVELNTQSENYIVANLGADGYKFGKKRNKKAYKFRKYLIDNAISTGIISNGGFEIKKLTTKLVREINYKINKYTSTILDIESFLTGSNVPGSETNLLSNPICLSTDEYDGYRFSHLFKRLRKKDYTIKYENSARIDFDEFLDMFNLRSTFELYNKDIICYENGYAIPSEWTKKLEEEIGIEVKDNDFKKLEKQYSENRNYKLSDRIKLRINLLNRFHNQPDQLYKIHPANLLEACHIAEVKNIDITKNGIDLDNPDNGILMPSHIHTMFDKYYFTFNLNGAVLYNIKYIKFIEFHGINNLNISDMIIDYPGMIPYLEQRLKIYKERNP